MKYCVTVTKKGVLTGINGSAPAWNPAALPKRGAPLIPVKTWNMHCQSADSHRGLPDELPTIHKKPETVSCLKTY